MSCCSRACVYSSLSLQTESQKYYMYVKDTMYDPDVSQQPYSGAADGVGDAGGPVPFTARRTEYRADHSVSLRSCVSVRNIKHQNPQ